VHIDTGVPYQIAITDPLTVTIGGQEFTLGTVEMILIAATIRIEGDLIRAVPLSGNNSVHRVFHPDLPLPDPASVRAKSTVLHRFWLIRWIIAIIHERRCSTR
jgi:hypothetical protein